MIRFTRVNEAISGTLARLVVKVLRLGSKDVQTALNVANFGVDSSPIKGMVAIHADTGIEGETIILGYIKPDIIAQPGETHLYSTDQNGVDSFRIKLLTDGTAEIGGDADFMVRFNELKTAFDQLKSDHDNFASAFNNHIHPTPSGPSSPPTPVPSVIPVQPSTADIDPAKIEEIKTL